MKAPDLYCQPSTEEQKAPHLEASRTSQSLPKSFVKRCTVRMELHFSIEMHLNLDRSNTKDAKMLLSQQLKVQTQIPQKLPVLLPKIAKYR